MTASNHPDVKLIIGLGNPGKKYENTYHNVGHLFIDYLQKTYDLRPTTYDLIKSDVYMNESGKFVKKAIKNYGSRMEQTLIVHDDSDIEIGNYKLSFNRGAAGHHGIEDIQRVLKTSKFWRLRIGIRPKQKADLPAETQRVKAGKFVLKKINLGDKKTLSEVFQKAANELKNLKVN